MSCSQCPKAPIINCECGVNFCSDHRRSHRISHNKSAEIDNPGNIISKVGSLKQKLTSINSSLIKHVMKRSKPIIERLEEHKRMSINDTANKQRKSSVSRAELQNLESVENTIESWSSNFFSVVDKKFQELYHILGLETIVDSHAENTVRASDIKKQILGKLPELTTRKNYDMKKTIGQLDLLDKFILEHDSLSFNKTLKSPIRPLSRAVTKKNLEVSNSILCSENFLNMFFAGFYKKVEAKYKPCTLKRSKNEICIEADKINLLNIKQELNILIEKFEFKDYGHWEYIGKNGYIQYDGLTNTNIENEYRRVFPELIKDSYTNYKLQYEIKIGGNFYVINFAKFGGAHRQVNLYNHKQIQAVRRVSKSDYFDKSLIDNFEWFYYPQGPNNAKKLNFEATFLLDAAINEFRVNPILYIPGENNEQLVVDLEKFELTIDQDKKCKVERRNIRVRYN